MSSKKKEMATVETLKLPKPSEIKAYLDQYVIGQEDAKKVLSVAVYNHYKKVINNSRRKSIEDTEIGKSNCIMPGPTGCGKTFLVKTIAKMLNVPCYIQDTTKLTASGYVGSDVEDCLVGLLRTCDYNLDAAQVGIVVLDECDKISKKDAGPSITRDVSGECVQQSLLKIVEGDVVSVPPQGGRKHPEQEYIYIDTTNILFIASGAFVGLEEVIKRRLGSNQIGFNVSKKFDNEEDNVLKYTTPEDLRTFGLIPEFVGRFPIITHVNELKEDDLVVILNEPKNSLVKQYECLLGLDGKKIVFENDALRAIAKLAIELKTGARGLRAIMEDVMLDIMYIAPESDDKVFVITKTMVEEKTKNKYKK